MRLIVFLFLFVACVPAKDEDSGTRSDAGVIDSGTHDGGVAHRDAAPTDATDASTPEDTGSIEDSGINDTGSDSGSSDSGISDSGINDTGGVVDASGVWSPAPGTSWQWQINSGNIDDSIEVDMYDIDLFEVSQNTIDSLHTDGRIVICYFSAGSIEDWRSDANQFPQSAIGNLLDNWPGENWIDIRDSTVRSIMSARMDLAVSKSCDGVEPDNVDGYTNNTGFPLTGANQRNFNQFLATEAHNRSLSVGLKNDVDQVVQLEPYFDWALNEECFEYDECDTLLPFINAGKAVFNVEYGGAGLANTVCPRANALNFDTLIKNYDLDPWRIACR